MRRQFPWVLPALVIVVIFAFLFSISQKNAEPKPLANQLRVVATISPIAIFAKNVAGDLAQIELLVDPGTDLHEYSLKPSGAAKLAQADVIIKNGGIDDFVDALVRDNTSAKQIINLSNSINTTKPGLSFVQPGLPSSVQVFPKSNNPHYWVNPAFAIKMTEAIRDGLIRADLKNAEKYAVNTERYLSDLMALDGEYRGTIARFKNKKFVSLEPAFTYLAREYGLIESAVITPDPDISATPTQLRRVINQMKQEDIKILLTSRGELPSVLKAVAKETGATVVEFDTMHSVEPDPGAYLARMRSNLQTLKNAFK